MTITGNLREQMNHIIYHFNRKSTMSPCYSLSQKMFCEMSWRNHSPNHVWDGVIRFQPEDQILPFVLSWGWGWEGYGKQCSGHREDSRE